MSSQANFQLSNRGRWYRITSKKLSATWLAKETLSWATGEGVAFTITSKTFCATCCSWKTLFVSKLSPWSALVSPGWLVGKQFYFFKCEILWKVFSSRWKLPCGNDKKPPVQAICSLPRVICQYLASFRYFPIFRLLDKSNTADGQFLTYLILDTPGGICSGWPKNNIILNIQRFDSR